MRTLGKLTAAAVCIAAIGGLAATSGGAGSDATQRVVRAPQFVLASFDGASDQTLIDYWTQVGKRTNAKFTYFFSSVYLLDWAHRTEYKPPRRSAGASAIGFARIPAGVAPKTKIRWSIEALRRAQAAGHEVGTHFAGHFCGTTGVSRWSTADWSKELDQVDQLAKRVDRIMGLSPATGGPFAARIMGGRTPCLEGVPSAYLPAMRQRGMVYDTSETRSLNQWPRLRYGMWEFGVPFVYPPGSSRGLLLLDYNFSLRYGGGSSSYAEDVIYRTLMRSFNTSYNGNRAPLDIAAHTQRLMGGAWNRALARFYTDVCRRKDVRCSTYRDAAAWMKAHANQLARLQRDGTYVEDVPPPPTTTKPPTTTTKPPTTTTKPPATTTKPATTTTPATPAPVITVEAPPSETSSVPPSPSLPSPTDAAPATAPPSS